MCERIACGESVRQICLLPGMPVERTFYRWLLGNETFQAQYTKAKELQTAKMEEDLLEIADDGRNDWIERESERGERRVVLNDEAVQRSKLRVSTRQWLMGKLKAKKYGDRVEVTGEGAKTEINISVTMPESRRALLMERRRKAMEAGNN